MKNNDYIWLFGENLAKTANSNSFHFWKYIVNLKDNIKKFLILEKNNNNLKVYNSLNHLEKKFVIWKNSFKHFYLFSNADLLFVSLNYKDVTPDKFLYKDLKMHLKKSFVHLQNGVCGIEKLNERGNSYNNSIIRYLSYNSGMNDNLIKYNKFKDYQILYEKYVPRYGDLIRKVDENKTPSQILWYISYRNYVKKGFLHVKTLSLFVKRVVKDESLREYLTKNNLKLKVCTHILFEDVLSNELLEFNDEIISIVNQKDIDLNLEIAKSKLLISDFSPLIYDFSLLKRPYLIFQPDLFNVNRKKDLYRSSRVLDDIIIKRADKLIDKILSADFETHDYIECVNIDKDDFEYVKQDKHLYNLYNYFKDLQFHKITFLGYNFYGIGGTVNATMALAEGLLREGYFVNCISLKRLSKFKHEPPSGLNVQYLSWDKSGSKKEKLYNKIFCSHKYYKYLEYDPSKKFLPPFVGYKLNKLMTNIRTNTLVSTRETLHLFLNDCTSEHVKNKIFFFHTIANTLDNLFPGVIDKINKTTIDKAIFITNQNRIALKEQFDYDNYNQYINIGNSLIQSKILDKKNICPIEKKEKYNAIYLLRVSKDRKGDINNLINFAEYVKENNIDFIDIDVFGDGDYVDKFNKLIHKKNLSDRFRKRPVGIRPAVGKDRIVLLPALFC